MLIEAFSILKRREGIPHALLLFGANRDGTPFREVAERCGVSDSVFQTDGRVTEHRELAEVYNAASVYVLPSSSEGFSLTLAEALSCGTPAITVNCASLGEVAHGYALTIDTPNLEDLTEAIGSVLRDPDLARALRPRDLDHDAVRLGGVPRPVDDDARLRHGLLGLQEVGVEVASDPVLDLLGCGAQLLPVGHLGGAQ